MTPDPQASDLPGELTSYASASTSSPAPDPHAIENNPQYLIYFRGPGFTLNASGLRLDRSILPGICPPRPKARYELRVSHQSAQLRTQDYTLLLRGDSLRVHLSDNDKVGGPGVPSALAQHERTLEWRRGKLAGEEFAPELSFRREKGLDVDRVVWLPFAVEGENGDEGGGQRAGEERISGEDAEQGGGQHEDLDPFVGYGPYQEEVPDTLHDADQTVDDIPEILARHGIGSVVVRLPENDDRTPEIAGLESIEHVRRERRWSGGLVACKPW